MEQTEIKMASIPPPIDGIDYISPPYDIKPSSARDLMNYYIFDWGIRQIHKPIAISTFPTAIGSMHPVDGGGGITPCILVLTTNKIWRVIPSIPTVTDITVSAVTSNFWNMNQFNKKVFGFNGVDVPWVYDIGTAVHAAAGWSGPATVNNLYQGWNYKHRQYAFEKDTSICWYGHTNDATTGPMDSVDFGAEFHTYGPICFGTSWSYNQGLSNDELMVVVNVNGEVLVYSGSNPINSNWEMIGRASIPVPVGSKSFVKLGQDVLIGTVRGVISLKDVFAGRNEDASYFSVSKNINPVALLNCEVAFNKNLPFVYFQNSTSTDYSTYVLNYERAAWSRLNLSFTTSNKPIALAWLGGGALTGSNAIYYALNDSSHTLNYIPDAASDSTGVVSTWKTAFLTFDSLYTKLIKFIWVTVRNISSLTSSSVVVSVATQALGDTVGTAESATKTGATDNEYYYLEIRPPGINDTPSFVFSKTGAGEINEINGCDIFYEEGGL